MSAAGSLSPTQFNVERNIIAQGNPDELTTRVRGIQNMTSNVYRPSFSSDYTSVRSTQSPASAEDGERPSAGQVEEDEDEEE
jgi:hypothetical protein